MDEQTLNKALERHSAWIHGGGEAGSSPGLIAILIASSGVPLV